MFVSTGAVKKIRKKRKAVFYERYIIPLLHEASNLGISKHDLTEMINKARGGKNGEN